MECCHNENILLKSSRLSVDIASPGTYYKRSRFDWNGFITQVTLDGVHTFCVPESLTDGKGCGGNGLCGEFGIHEPVGYDETPAGGCFPKIGVGCLTKPDAVDYKFFRDYEVKPFHAVVFKNERCAEFLTNPVDCGGYAYLYKKMIEVEDTTLKIKYYLENTGNKAIHTTEYCHNFLRIDHKTVGSDYILKLPYKPELNIVHGGMEMASYNEITWVNSDFEHDFYCMIRGYEKNAPHVWDLYNKKARVGVREHDDFPPDRFALWGAKHVISPEIFIKIDLAPGEHLNWTRSYKFYTR